MTTPDSSMNQVLRGRGRPVSASPASPDADPLAQAKAIAGELAGQLDTLNRLLAKAEAAAAKPLERLNP